MAKTYVEKYTKIRNPKGADLVKVRHTRTNKCKAGFDNTTFDSQSDFTDIIDKYNMEYRRVEMPDNRFRYTWSNKKVMLVTEWNPISNRKSDGSKLMSTKNSPRKMGVSGDCQTVDRLVEDLRKNARSVKGVSPNSRAFI